MIVYVSQVYSQHNKVLIGVFEQMNMHILDAFCKETGGLGDQRKFMRTTRRFITCLYCIQFEKKIDMFPILNV